ncbi:hypothetical protein, partial [Gluconacetobacter diazotrophicus]|uniref:hypothetical protein n=1 Tax=Gluconacetobacter diazotrophicus TaxID=33996 RepID=UPI001C97A6B0
QTKGPSNQTRNTKNAYPKDIRKQHPNSRKPNPQNKPGIQPPQTIQQKTRPSGRRQHIPSFSLTILLSKTTVSNQTPSPTGPKTLAKPNHPVKALKAPPLR